MAKKTATRKLTYKQAINVPVAETLRAKVGKPRILTLGDVVKAVDGLPSTKAIFGQLSSASVKPKKLSNAKSLKADLEQFAELSPDTPAYTLMKSKGEAYSAWPIIWAGENNSKFIIVGYHDPVRFGFPSESTGVISIGPDKPWTTQDREFGVGLAFEPPKRGKSGCKVIMEPMGERLTGRQLTSRYGSSWRKVLKGSFQLFGPEGKNTIYRFQKPLPLPEEFESLLRKKCTKTVLKWVEEAFSIIEELGSDLRDAFENTPESLQESDVGMARNEAATILEELAYEKPAIPETLKRKKVFVPPPKRLKSRRDQANEAADILEAVNQEVSKHGDLCEAQEFKKFTSQIEDTVSNLEDVEFPGMFG